MTKLVINSQFKINLEELWFDWWSKSVHDVVVGLNEEQILEWFLSEVKATTKQIMIEMKTEEDF